MHRMNTSRHRKKREAKIKKEIKRGVREPNEQNPFEIFITVTDIRYTYVWHFHSTSRFFTMQFSDTIRNHTKFSEIRTGCVSFKTLRQSRPTYLRER